MKSAYELAMERLGGPAPALTDEQKSRLAEVDKKIDAKIAEKRISLGRLLDEARATANYIEQGQLEEQLAREIAKFNKQRETEKDEIRGEKS
jgi:hypothetical protein